MWNKRVNAPSTIFTARNSMSPRQVASKAYTLACKKLDRDERRRRPSYNVRERVLLYNTMNKADNVLNKPKARTNRRVVAAEDEVGYDDPPQSNQHHQHYPPHHHSPLACVSLTDEDDQAEDQEIQAALPQPQQPPVVAASVPPQQSEASTPIPMDIEPSIPREKASAAEITEPSLASVPPAPQPVPSLATVQVLSPLLPLSLLPNPSITAHSSIIPLDLPALECRVAVSHSSYKFTCTPPVIV